MKVIKKILAWLLLAVIVVLSFALWKSTHKPGFGPGFASGNGRLEATEIDIAAKMGGRIRDIRVDEGDYVKDGELLAIMDTSTLEAQLYEAVALVALTRAQESSAISQVAARESDVLSAQAAVEEYRGNFDKTQRRFERTRVLTQQGVETGQQYDDDETNEMAALGALGAAQAKVGSAEMAVEAARANADAANAAIKTALANVATVEAELHDCYLYSPRAGRIQYRIAQPGEVVGAGGKVLNLIDLDDVYMNVFLSTAYAGQAAIGSEARIVLDAFPDRPIPARIAYVSETAQFTPKTVETASERQKLMFRVRVKINPEAYQHNPGIIKPGLPGLAWVRLDEHAPWPSELAASAPGSGMTRDPGRPKENPSRSMPQRFREWVKKQLEG